MSKLTIAFLVLGTLSLIDILSSLALGTNLGILTFAIIAGLSKFIGLDAASLIGGLLSFPLSMAVVWIPAAIFSFIKDRKSQPIENE